MSRCVFAASLLLTSAMFGQDAPDPALKLVPSADANLLKNPSFEQPPVSKRLSVKENGSPARTDESKTNWAHFQVIKQDEPGKGRLTIGLTNEFARSGKQSVFVDFDKLTSRNRRSFLMSDLLPVKPATGYTVSIWGRTDDKRPLTLDQRLALMKVEFEYFTPDTESQAGTTDNRTLMIPGNSKRIFFVSDKWMEYATNVRTPRDAGWMKVTFRWETGNEEGMTDGAIYFDDATVAVRPGNESLIPVDESDAAKPEPEEGESSPSEAAANPAAPAAPPKKP
jgi:hypothetical protein